MFHDVRSMLGTDVLLTVDEFAAAAGMQRSTVVKRIRRGELVVARLTPRKVLIPTKHLTEDIIDDVIAHSESLRLRRLEQLVYFIQAESGPIKIGVAYDPAERLAGLQIAHFEQLSLRATLSGGLALETDLHSRFAHLNIRGEWFRPAPDLLAVIDDIKRLDAGVRA